MLKIDGSYGEGGGQIVRTALALSCITQKEICVFNIRKGRKVPGLKKQHVHAILGLEKLCHKVSYTGVEVGSEEITFKPGPIKGGLIEIDIETAGSITLLMQSLLLPAFFARRKVIFRIKGGTDVAWSMQFDYFKEVFVPQLRKYCKNIEVKLLNRGYYPKGQGSVEIIIQPKWDLSSFFDSDDFFNEMHKYPKIDLGSRDDLLLIKGVSHSSDKLIDAKVSERMSKQARLELLKFGRVSIRDEYRQTASAGCGLCVWGIFGKESMNFEQPQIFGVDVLGRKGVSAEKIAKEVVSKFSEVFESGNYDENIGDNLIPWMSIFGGIVKCPISEHTKTNVWVCEQFFDVKFAVDDKNNSVRVKFE